MGDESVVFFFGEALCLGIVKKITIPTSAKTSSIDTNNLMIDSDAMKE